MKTVFAILILSVAVFAQLPKPGSGGGGGGGSGTGTVTDIETACGVAGGPITTAGTIYSSLAVDPQNGAGAFAIPYTDCGKLISRNQTSASLHIEYRIVPVSPS